MSDAPQSTIHPNPATDTVEPVDDWAGLTNQAERRRRQNRINQRARSKFCGLLA